MRRIAVLAIALLAILIALFWQLHDVPPPVAAVTAAPRHAETGPVVPEVARPPPPRPAPSVAAVPPQPELGSAHQTPPVLDGVDPCAAVEEPPIPTTFEVKSVGNITLAWRNDPDLDAEPLSPMMIGRVADGVLEDAAEATGTTPRGHLTIVIYPTIQQLRADTHAPAWAGGLYDGAVRLVASRFDGIGVDIAVLRHETMHAQLHAAVGCMPAWLNEGIAMFFEHDPDVHALVDLVRVHELVDVEAMGWPAIQDLPDKHPERLYAESLAMVMYALDHGDGQLRTLVARYAEARPDQRMAIWTRWFPEARAPQLVDHVAHRMFGIGTGGALDAILRGTLCCTGRHDVMKLACQPPGMGPPEDDRKIWVDRSRRPSALCDAHY